MPINWALHNPNFGQQLGQVFDPNVIQERNNRLAELAQGKSLRDMQLMQGVESLNRAPVLRKREDEQYQAQQAEALRVKALRDRESGLLEQLKTADPAQRAQIFTQLYPKEAATASFKPDDSSALVAVIKDGKPVMLPRSQAVGLAPVKAAAGGADAQRGQIVFDNQGRAFNVNPYTNEVRPVAMGGNQIQGAQYSPALQGQISGAKAFEKTVEEDRAKAIADAPRVIDNANEALRLADALVTHPGMKQAVGASSLLGLQKVPGTEAKDFMNRLDQIRGGAFLEAFNTLKGGGQITEVEGKKATDAIARMDNATSEDAFKQAVADYQSVIRTGVERAKRKAGAHPPAQGGAPTRTQSGVTTSGW